MNPCKRAYVEAYGIKELVKATNGNLGECTGEVGNCGCIHAEDNLLSNNKGIKIIYVNYSPCINCAKKIVEYGIKTVIYKKEYRLLEGLEYLIKNDVKVYKILDIKEGEKNQRQVIKRL